jgi:flagellar basal-body rod modification protein FlgD
METSISNIQQQQFAQASVPPSKSGDLNMDDFFKLLTVQLTSQDPLKPMDDTEFISQMTGFSSLSEMENMAKDMKALRLVQSSFSAQMLIGREVTATGSSGETIKGVVTRVAREGDDMVPYVGDKSVLFESIKEISNEVNI